MAAQKGNAIVINVDSNGMGTFVAIGGLRTKSLTINQELVDITNSDSTNQWRELLAGGGIKNMAIAGSGVFTDDAGSEDVRGYIMAGTSVDYQFTIPDFGTFEGPFVIESQAWSGEFNAEVTQEISLQSAGEIAFTAA